MGGGKERGRWNGSRGTNALYYITEERMREGGEGGEGKEMLGVEKWRMVSQWAAGGRERDGKDRE